MNPNPVSETETASPPPLADTMTPEVDAFEQSLIKKYVAVKDGRPDYTEILRDLMVFTRSLETRLRKAEEERDALRKNRDWWQDKCEDRGHSIEVLKSELAQSSSELSAMKAAHEWRAIETAPKDGTHILLLCAFDDGFREPKEIMSGWWTTHKTWSCCLNRRKWDVPIPTHWRPLPTPPQPSTQGEVASE